MNLFIIYLQQDLSRQQFERLALLPDKEKRTKIARYRIYADAQRSLLGDLLVRYAAVKYYDIPNSALRFSADSCGKPILVSHPEIQYNISHTGNYVACAMGKAVPVGIDIERIRPIRLDIARRFFTAEEYAHLDRLAPEMQLPCFYSMWTKKESFIKMVGKGLSIPLNSFSVLEGEHPHAFWQFIENNEVVGNLCTESPAKTALHWVSCDELAEVLGPPCNE